MTAMGGVGVATEAPRSAMGGASTAASHWRGEHDGRLGEGRVRRPPKGGAA
jgi:hypothetical protein